MSVETNERLAAVLSIQNRVKEKEPQLSPDEVRFQSLLLVMESKTMSYRAAITIVGGKVRLQRLMDNGSIRCEKPKGSINTTWKLNAADCYRNIRPRVKQIVK